MRIADLARRLGDFALSERLGREAAALTDRFNETFWCEDLDTYALALDGNKKPCRVRSSNAGQCLYCGIVPRDRARRLVRMLLLPELSCGWGIRTIAATEARYNPMSYHNGSVWPHDNALIAAGMAKLGFRGAAMRVFRGLFAASRYLELHRLPELFCGFARRGGEGPTLYPVACNPQAWSAGSVFMLLQSCLGLTLNAPRRQIVIRRPRLPLDVHEITIHDLRIGNAACDLRLYQERGDIGVLVERKDRSLEIVVSK